MVSSELNHVMFDDPETRNPHNYLSVPSPHRNPQGGPNVSVENPSQALMHVNAVWAPLPVVGHWAMGILARLFSPACGGFITSQASGKGKRNILPSFQWIIRESGGRTDFNRKESFLL